MILINGKPESRINISDRGLQYGDGLFETLAYRQHQLELWPMHRARLILGCQRLKINFDSAQLKLLETEMQQVLSSLSSDAVIKVIVTRGEGGRGYRPDPESLPSRIISTHPLPDYPASYNNGVVVRWCDQTVSQNRALAGLKHLNRLEQVLARSEWENSAISEGLMLNQHQHVIEGTMSNVFMVIGDKLITPELSLSGVAGVMREAMIELAELLGVSVEQRAITKTELLSADELFLTNSIIKIWPIIRIEGNLKAYPHGPLTQQLQSQLAERLALQ